MMEGADPRDPQAVREVALKLQEELGLTSDATPMDRRQQRRCARDHEDRGAKPDRRSESTENTPAVQLPKAKAPPPELPRVVNAPLDFELKRLDARHPYLAGRGLSFATIDRFGLGYCASGLMAGRIAIPIHDGQGRLVAYAGRMVDESKIGPDCPKYLLPGERVRDRKVHQFHKSLLLFNAHRVKAPVQELVVVEGFFSVFWAAEHGYRDVVCLMGSACSDEQYDLILKLTTENGRIVLLLDGNQAGVRCTQQMIERLSSRRAVRWARLDDGRQPTDCEADELKQLLGSPPARPIGAEKSGTSDEPDVADPAKTSNDKAGDPTAAQ